MYFFALLFLMELMFPYYHIWQSNVEPIENNNLKLANGKSPIQGANQRSLIKGS